MSMLRMSYGISPRWAIMLQSTASNHHGRNLPENFIQPNGGLSGGYHIHNHIGHIGDYPYVFNGFILSPKWMFLKRDGEKRHLRAALYMQGAWLNIAPHLAEGNLNGQNSGCGGGGMVTGLYKRVALSLNAGVEYPFDYRDDPAGLLFKYGRSLYMHGSLGVLTFPFSYKSYDQVNVNLYVEMLSRWYQDAEIYLHDENVPVSKKSYPDLIAGNYVEAAPGIQFIFGSNTRVDLVTGFPLYNRSYNKDYPFFQIQLQRYFYLGHRNG